MGFADWEFVNAYAANRKGLLVIAAEASAVARLIVILLKCYPGGFQGRMEQLYKKLEAHQHEVPNREWPKNPIKLSNQLRRCDKALNAVGVYCELDIDNRRFGGSQHDLIIERGDDWNPIHGKKQTR